MKRYFLLLAWPVIEQLETLPKTRRHHIYKRLLELEDHPDILSDFADFDERGRALEVLLCDGWAFFYWIDFADRQVKVLEMKAADAGRG